MFTSVYLYLPTPKFSIHVIDTVIRNSDIKIFAKFSSKYIWIIRVRCKVNHRESQSIAIILSKDSFLIMMTYLGSWCKQGRLSLLHDNQTFHSEDDGNQKNDAEQDCTWPGLKWMILFWEVESHILAKLIEHHHFLTVTGLFFDFFNVSHISKFY